MKGLQYFFFANVLKMVGGFLVLPILLMRLSAEDFGLYVLYLSIGSFLSLILGGNLQQSITAYYYQWVEEKRYHISYSIIFLLLVFSSTFFAIVAFSIGFFIRAIGLDFSIALVGGVFFVGLFTLFSDFCLLVIRMEGRAKLYFLLSVIAVSLDLSSKYIYVQHVENTSVYELLLVNCIGLSVSFLFVLGVFAFRVKWKYIKWTEFSVVAGQSFNYSRPLLFAALVTRFTSLSDKLFVGLLLGAAELGVYALASRVYGVIASFRSNVKSIWVPYAIKRKDNFALVKRSADMFMVSSLVIGLLGFLAMFPFVAIFVKDDSLVDSVSVVGLFVCANLFATANLVASVVIPISKNSSPVTKIQVCSSLVSLLTLYVFCFCWGVSGVLLSIMLNNLIQIYLIKRAYNNIYLTPGYRGALFLALIVAYGVYFFGVSLESVLLKLDGWFSVFLGGGMSWGETK